jgi:hypothetical protein
MRASTIDRITQVMDASIVPGIILLTLLAVAVKACSRPNLDPCEVGTMPLKKYDRNGFYEGTLCVPAGTPMERIQ